MNGPIEWIWQQIAGNFLWWLITGCVFALFALGRWIRRWRKERHFRRLMESFLRDCSEIPLVVAEVHPVSILVDAPTDDTQSLEVPSFASFIGMQEGMGIAYLQEKLLEAFPRKRFPLMMANRFDPGKFPVFFSIGGTVANRITRSVFHHEFVVNGLEFNPETFAIKDRIANVSHSVDQASDYGIIILTRNPFYEEGRCCLLYGGWAQGSKAAIEYLLRPTNSTNKGQSFVKLGKQSNMLAIVRTSLSENGLVQSLPMLVSVRPIMKHYRESDEPEPHECR